MPARDGLEEPAAIALDGQYVVALPVADGLRRVGPAMQGVGGDKSAAQIEQGKNFESAGNLIAIGGLPLSQRHARACCPDIDHMQRRSLPAPHEGSAQGLAVDADHALDAETLAELAQDRFQTFRVQHTEDVAECVVAGNAVSKLQELPQQLLSAFAKKLELGAGLGPSQRRCQGNEKDLHQIVSSVAGAGILERSKQALELAHSGLPRESGDTQRIQFRQLCNTPPAPYAIPPPPGGTTLTNSNGLGPARARDRWRLWRETCPPLPGPFFAAGRADHRL